MHCAAIALVLLLAHHACCSVASAPFAHDRRATVYPTAHALSSAWAAEYVTRNAAGDIGSLAVRDMSAAAFILLSLSDGAAIDNATALLTTVVAHQLPDGQWPWLFSEPTCEDENSVQFTSLPLARALLAYGPSFPAEWVASLRPHLILAAEASWAEGSTPGSEAQPYYTNIATMRAVNLRLLADLTGNATIAGWAASALSAWTAEVDASGLHEYSSPTYSAVALANLAAGAAATLNATAAGVFSTYGRFMAAAAAAVYFPPALASGGPHSRDYDFVFGSAGMGWWYLFTTIVESTGGGSNDTWLGFEDPITQASLYCDWYRGELPPPPSAIIQLAGLGASSPSAPPSRTFRTTYSAVPGPLTALNGSDITALFTRTFSIGLSSAAYGPMDKEFVAQLGPEGPLPLHQPRIPQFTVVLDRFDAPYGDVKLPDSSGHEKATHLAAASANVASGGLALLAFDVRPALLSSRGAINYTSIAINVVFPGAPGVAGVYSGSSRVPNASWGAPAVPVAPGSASAVRSAGGVIAWRFLGVDALPHPDAAAPMEPTASLLFDGPQGSQAARAVAYLYGPHAPNRTFWPPPATARAAVVVFAADAGSDEEALAAVMWLQNLSVNAVAENGVWIVGATPPVGDERGTAALAIALNTSSGAILQRSVNGIPIVPPPSGTLQVTWANGTMSNIRPGTL